MQGNKLLPIACLFLVAMLLFLGLRSGRDDSDAAKVVMDQVPVAPPPDADSAADTVRTLVAEVANLKAQNEVLEQKSRELLRQRKEIEGHVTNKLEEERKVQESMVGNMVSKLEQMETRMKEGGSDFFSAGSDIPAGLGIGDGGLSIGESNPALSAEAVQIVWVDPLDTQSEKDGGGALTTLLRRQPKDSGSLLHPDGKETPQAAPVVSTNKVEAKLEPAYTIPRNATLIGAVGMTALIGRIPFDGKVEDPFPFKVLVGRDNLAANGLEIPGVFGMVFSGEAFGQWSLGCVRGKVISATYLFDDGTIRTLSSDDNSLRQSSQQNQQGTGGNGRQSAPLGYLSDPRGVPCVSGEKISNTGSYLLGRILARAAEGLAGALSQGEATRQASALTGINTTTVTGDIGKFAEFSALGGAASEVSDYIKERAAQSFDVVYVDVGAEVAVHIDRELPIDYNRSGRKLTYARNSTDRANYSPHLD